MIELIAGICVIILLWKGIDYLGAKTENEKKRYQNHKR